MVNLVLYDSYIGIGFSAAIACCTGKNIYVCDQILKIIQNHTFKDIIMCCEFEKNYLGITNSKAGISSQKFLIMYQTCVQFGSKLFPQTLFVGLIY